MTAVPGKKCTTQRSLRSCEDHEAELFLPDTPTTHHSGTILHDFLPLPALCCFQELQVGSRCSLVREDVVKVLLHANLQAILCRNWPLQESTHSVKARHLAIYAVQCSLVCAARYAHCSTLVRGGTVENTSMVQTVNEPHQLCFSSTRRLKQA